MRVLVTGANGFVGSALCPYLVGLGHEVVPAVRRPTGIPNEIIVHDEVSWKAALDGCDSVIHLAGRAHVMLENELDPLQAFRTNNVTTTKYIANYAFEVGVRRFVFMSTIKVNGQETAQGFSFQPGDLAGPKDPYAISKWEAEQCLLEIALKTGLEVVIIRPPLVYGPGVKGNFKALIKMVKSGVPLPLGALHNRRSMIGLDNLINFTMLCANIDASPCAKDQVFLISDGEDVSTPELLRKVAKAYRCSLRLFPVPLGLIRLTARFTGKVSLAERVIGSLVIDNSKARLLLGWHPSISMDEQLQKMALLESIV